MNTERSNLDYEQTKNSRKHTEIKWFLAEVDVKRLIKLIEDTDEKSDMFQSLLAEIRDASKKRNYAKCELSELPNIYDIERLRKILYSGRMPIIEIDGKKIPLYAIGSCYNFNTENMDYNIETIELESISMENAELLAKLNSKCPNMIIFDAQFNLSRMFNID